MVAVRGSLKKMARLMALGVCFRLIVCIRRIQVYRIEALFLSGSRKSNGK